MSNVSNLLDCLVTRGPVPYKAVLSKCQRDICFISSTVISVDGVAAGGVARFTEPISRLPLDLNAEGGLQVVSSL